MNSINSLSALASAQASFDSNARSIAKNGPSPDNIVGLLSSKNQFEADVKTIETQNKMNEQLLDIFA